MKALFLMTVVCVAAILASACVSSHQPNSANESAQPPQKTSSNMPKIDRPNAGSPIRTTGNLIIYYDGDKTALMNAVALRDDTLIYDYNTMNGIAIRPKLGDGDEVIRFYQNIDGVLQVMRDEVHELNLPNTPQ